MHRILRRFSNKSGSVLLVSVIFACILMTGATLLMLVAQINIDANGRSQKIYDRYTYESLTYIMTQELLSDLTESSASMYYSPLLSSEELETKLQEGLLSAYVNAAGEWRYGSLIPSSVTSIKYAPKVTLNDFNVKIDPDIDLLSVSALDYDCIKLSIQFCEFTSEVQLNGLKVEYSFGNNRVTCKFDTTSVKTQTKFIL